MSKNHKEFLKKEKETDASRPPAPVPSATAKFTEKDASPEMSSPRSERSLQVSDFTADSDSSFDPQRLAPVSEEAETKTTAEKDSDSSKNQAAIPSVKSTGSKESSGTSEKGESDEKAASISPEECATPPNGKVTLKSNDETPESVAMPGVLMTHQSLYPDFYKDLDVKELSPVGTAMVEEAWERLNKSFVCYRGNPVGTLGAMDPMAEALTYNPVFVRDIFPTGLACLMEDPAELEIVKNFLLKTLLLQGQEKTVDNFTLREGVLPASFKVLHDSRVKETIAADFGGSTNGRVALVDSGLWWIILLRSYTKCTHDYVLLEFPEVQKGMKLILNLCLSDGFDTFPTLCADGCSRIDRRMGIYGYPIEIQALFYIALRCARQMVKPESDDRELLERIDKRITALSFHNQKYNRLDFTEEYSHTAVNKFNVMPFRGGYLIGNVSPAPMDFWWLLVGNCIAILSSLATPAQATAIMELIEGCWTDLISEMPLLIAYPALEGPEWRIITGGSLPTLLWMLTAACIKTGMPFTAQKATELAEQRLSKESIPNGTHVDKGKRKRVEDVPSSSCASSSKKNRSIELVVDEDGDETLDGGVEGGLNVYWVDIYAHFLERVEGVEQMRDRIVLGDAVDDVLVRHQHPLIP